MKAVLIFFAIMLALILAKGFDDLSFGEAVGYVNGVAVILWGLWLSIPVGAVAALFRSRRNAASKTMVVHMTLWSWLALMGLAVWYFFSGAWYGENGPAPQIVAVQMAWILVGASAFTIGLQTFLYITTRPAGMDSCAGSRDA